MDHVLVLDFIVRGMFRIVGETVSFDGDFCFVRIPVGIHRRPVGGNITLLPHAQVGDA